MLKGETITLRLVHESDLEQLHNFHQDIENRGQYFPVGVISQPVFQQRFANTGFWEAEEGMLLIVNDDDDILGHIEFFQTVSYLDELELSYHIYASKNSGKGIATEAVNLMTGYLFGRKKHNRIRLIIHPDNLASQRVAGKCGFIHEGTARGAWYHNGQNHDVEVYALLRKDFNNKEGVS